MDIAWIIFGICACLWVWQYQKGRTLHRVVAWGRDTYIRFYPNSGIGVCVGGRRFAASVVGGLEAFRKKPDGSWRRTWKALSRVPSRRNGGI